MQKSQNEGVENSSNFPIKTKRNFEPYYFWVVILAATAMTIATLILLMNFKSQQDVISAEMNMIPSGTSVSRQSLNDTAALEIVKTAKKLQFCPDELIDDRMPRVTDGEQFNNALPSKYYIYKGQRKEIAEFDADWVLENCKVKTEIVY